MGKGGIERATRGKERVKGRKEEGREEAVSTFKMLCSMPGVLRYICGRICLKRPVFLRKEEEEEEEEKKEE